MKKLIVVGALSLIGCVQEAPAPPAAQQTNNEAAIPATPVVFHAGESLTMEVPEMHCPFACYPKVKETLAEQPGVESVELVEQKDENAIDDPRVVVKLNGDFDATNAIDALAKVGFNQSVVQQTP